MAKRKHDDAVPADVLEFEVATRRALKAMRSGDRQRMLDAFVRYTDIYIKMSGKPQEQIVADAQVIERRGRIDLDDWKRILAASKSLEAEIDREAEAKGFPSTTGRPI